MNCATCKDKNCYKTGKDCTGRGNEIAGSYENEQSRKIMEAANLRESMDALMSSRVEEIVRFARKMKYDHLGIAFCVGCGREASALHKLLDGAFRVTSVCCKVCGIDKDAFNLQKMREDTLEVMCNPQGQADLLNRAKTNLNILVGLCVGHDILFTDNSKAPVTTLVVKDRALVNNPAGALLSPYWQHIIKERIG